MSKLYRLAFLAPLGFVSAAHAQTGVSLGFPTSFAGFSSQDLQTTIENVVRIILGFLGILAVVAVILGGFMIITSAGDSDKQGNGRKVVTAGVVGLIIILAAYAIASFVINSLQNAV